SASGLASATQKDGKWCVSLFWFRRSAPRSDARTTGRWCGHRHVRQCPIRTPRVPTRYHRSALSSPGPNLSPHPAVVAVEPNQRHGRRRTQHRPREAMTTPSDPHQPPGAHFGQHPPTGGLPAADDYSPQPPTKPKTTVIVSIVAVVVLVLGTLGMTGFVSPGFFLSDDKETTAAPVAEKTVESTEPAEPSEDASSPEIVADRIIMALKKGDVGALEDLMCPDA